ncbi:MAG TPA: cytidylate kinase-like family protein [Candidatus Limnocylindria bacterium]|nr:cytidylate kinase-like family protein [Candidatus Limnocylindria bacterium]
MPVITISRQFGAAGVPVGRALADRFKAEFLDRAIVAQVALRSGIPEDELESYDERLPGLWQRIASALATSSPEVTMPAIPYEQLPTLSTHDQLTQITRAVIEEAAERGNAVIVGRGAAFILGGRRNVINVQLHASLSARIRHLLMRVEEIPVDVRPDERSLEELCRSIDGARAAYIRQLYGVDWLHASHYDLTVDTGRLGVQRTVDLIESVARDGLADDSASPLDDASGG